MASGRRSDYLPSAAASPSNFTANDVPADLRPRVDAAILDAVAEARHPSSMATMLLANKKPLFFRAAGRARRAVRRPGLFAAPLK